MTKQEFKSLMAQAETRRILTGRQGYYEGYTRGLNRSYDGEKFGTFEEHKLWLAFFSDDDPTRAEKGRGYRDGLQGVKPRM